MFNKQSEEYLAVSRKEKTMVGMPLRRENLNYNSNYLQTTRTGHSLTMEILLSLLFFENDTK